MRKKEISEKVVGEEKIHEDYQILVWSKYKLRD